MKGTNRGRNLLTGIIVIEVPGEKPEGRKYRNIGNNKISCDRFENFAKTIPFADHINYYEKKTKKFLRQVILKK